MTAGWMRFWKAAYEIRGRRGKRGERPQNLPQARENFFKSSGYRTNRAACRLPWSGVWIKGDRELNITQQSLGSLGSCRSKNNDQYLLSSST
ncbi:hypothetical protein ANCCEY_00326 [Ancylostoma ceylanicum]|uniref:Uncharacterized protein n=1 Tax=Ancylostoma ceylanicum TaxID=53326 RepID=A0A0D6MDG3_9BILA|nr:hypothetical protein ANCCEY_00326 [Ancylostoma ceylanicum]